MADSTTLNDQANESLDLVSRELNSTLDTARREIESYLDGQSGGEALKRAAGMLHLACGALKLVELSGAALLAEEMEQTCQRLTELDDHETIERGVDALTRAMVQLPAYLERIGQGGRDVALVLLPMLNELREFCGKASLSEGTLLVLSAGPLARPSDAVATSETVGIDEAFRSTATKQRPLFQSALLGLIRGERVEANLDQLIAASVALEQASGAPEIAQLWRVLTAVLVALREGALEASVTLKRLIGQADRQLKRLIDLGVTASAEAPPVELVNNLLYYAARAESDDSRVASVRREFRLDDALPREEQIEQAREDLAGPSVKLLRTVAEAIKEDLGRVKDALDIFVRTGMKEARELEPQLDMLKKISDTLGVLGLEGARTRIHHETRQLVSIVNSGEVDDPGALEQIAATMLEVEDELDRELVKAVAPAGGSGAGAGQPAEDDDRTQYRHVTQAVMGECIVNLSRIKDAVTRIVDGVADVRSVDDVVPQLNGIVAGLLMLDKTKAVNVVERIGATITRRLAPGEPQLKPEYLERLADAIVSVEYYMETISLGRSDPWYMLDNAERCVELLENLPAGATARTQPAAEAAPTREPESGSETLAEEQPARPSVMQVHDERSDPELLEVFIEEAKEEVDNIRRHLPAWLDNLENAEALISVRRSFHTLKGSGRTVGADLLAEFAWSIENLLNRLINGTLEPTPEMLGFIGEAVDAVSPLVEQLEVGIRPEVDVELLMNRAEAFAQGSPEAASLATASQRAPAAEADDSSAEMDPVLTEIFVKETRGHLTTLNEFLDEAGREPGPHAVTEPLYRACHTLLGSARMADCRAAIELAKPLDEHIGRRFEHGPGLDDAAVGLLRDVAAEIERMVGTLAAGEPYAANAELVERLDALATPPAEAAPADASQAADAAAAADEAEAEAGADGASDVAAEVGGFDPEIAGIFADEAAEILEQAEATLQQLRDGSIAAEDGLHGLQRQLHTLKGGARMAGVVPMGNLSHALETLLAALGSGTAELSGATLNLVQRCLDELHMMRDGVDGGRVLDAAAGLVDEVHGHASRDERASATGGPRPADAEPAEPDATSEAAPEAGPATAAPGEADSGRAGEPAEARSGTETGPAAGLEPESGADHAPHPEPEAEMGAEPEAAPEPEAEAGSEPEAASEAEVGAEPEAASEAGSESAEAAPDAAAAPAQPAGSEPSPAEPAPEQAAAAAGAPSARAGGESALRPAERVETARVSADLLDTLLNGAGEISIFQSRLNQQVQSIEFHLGELGQTVTRLREQLRKLEAETEAQIINRHQEEGDDTEGFDPLELDRYSTIQQLSRALAETANDVASINELLYGLTTETDTLLTQQGRVTGEIQDGLMQTRMVSFQRHVARLQRIVRQASSETHKQAELAVEGAHSELDRHVLDSILPALEHLLRNAVVHGIETPDVRRGAGKAETGSVTLKLRREGTEVLVDVIDDGAGLNLDAIRRKAVEQGLVDRSAELSDDEARDMILRPGFSTAGRLTQAAGRGVGMDVVDNEVKKLGGSMRIDSTAGEGTRFLIRLPYTLAITHALIVEVGDETFALPLPTVEGITRVRRDQLLEILTNDDPRLDYGEVSYRVQHLGSLVGGAPSALGDEDNAVSLVLVRAGEHSTALLTDSIEGSREIVVKTLGPHLLSVPGVSGATILGDGRIIVILDPGTLVRRHAGVEPASAPVEAPPQRELTALVVDDSITMRRVTQRLLERRGVRVLTARDGLDAISVLQESEADVILLDIEMPRMDGYQFATHVRNDARLKDLPIIMVTSRSSEKHRAKAIEIGVNDYLSKPYQESQLVSAIEGLIGRSL